MSDVVDVVTIIVTPDKVTNHASEKDNNGEGKLMITITMKKNTKISVNAIRFIVIDLIEEYQTDATTHQYPS